MAITTIVGGCFLGASVVGAVVVKRPEQKMKRLLTEVMELMKVEVKSGETMLRPKVRKMQRKPYGFACVVELPKGFAVDKFRDKLPALEEATASKINLRYLRGREVSLQFGTQSIEPGSYEVEFSEIGELSIPYQTPFGLKHINLNDETSCNLIVAGATRMGKSVFLRLLFTSVTLQTNGAVKWFYINNKVSDWVPLKGVVPFPAETNRDAHQVLNEVFEETSRRKRLLVDSLDAVNVKQYRAFHPEVDMPPVFLVIDEYGRFAEDEAFQERITEIAETAAYLDIHLIIATQRPDATTVLKPRIRANILTRVCFQTADETNSNIVIHTGDAAHLDRIRGRCIVLDGLPTVAQIPYISEEQAAELLAPYRSVAHADTTGREDSEVPEALPRFVTGSLGHSRGI